MEIEINLWNDYIAILRTHLAASNFYLTGTETDDDIFIAFFNWKKRKVDPIPRKVHLSQEFQCPAEFNRPFTDIKSKIELGQDITPYLSKKIGELDYSDQMLNDWGIHHMHLGEILKPSGFVNRTGPLLFVRFTERDAYFVNIFAHGAWSKQEIVTTIHKNWSNIIEHYKLKDVVKLRFPPTDDDIAALRGAHINTMVQLDDGTVYSPIGMGLTLDGTAIDVVVSLNETKRTLRKAETKVQQEAKSKPATFAGLEKLRFILKLNGTTAYAVEEHSREPYKLW